MAISIKNPKEISALQIPNRIVAQSLDLAQKSAKEGMSLKELDSIVEDFILSCGAKPSFKGLYGFPCAVCISVNEVIIHGIPTDYRLKSGDIVGVDIGAEYNGWFGDGAITFGIGEITKTDKQRASYYNYYTSKKWGDSRGYHLTLDSSQLGIEGCVDMILDYRKHMTW